jgi:hypothetical protein
MAHFAKLNENGVVMDVVVINNSDIGDLPFPESEPVGASYLNSFLPAAVWKQTSYNGNFRARYASIGDTYMEQYDAFVPYKPAEDFIFDEALLLWVPPVPHPEDGFEYYWDLKISQWVRTPMFKLPLTVLE